MDLSPGNLLSIFRNARGRPVPLHDVMDHIGAPRSRQTLVLDTLMTLVAQGKLVRLRKRNFTLPTQSAKKKAQSIIHVSSRGKGFVLEAASDGSDLYVHSVNLGTAVDGDTVEVESFTGNKGREEGRVTRIVTRAHEYIVGQFSRTRAKAGTVVPRNVKIGRMVELHNAPPPDQLPPEAWVRVKVVRWPEGIHEPLVAKLDEVIGLPGEQGISILALLRDMGVRPEFPADTLHQAAHFHVPATKKELARRLDLREGLAILTIDPATAKDFDDALSVERLPDKNWRLGVHIADVAQYVQPDTPLDTEALRRGTSVYPVDRVVPMLPERLSNDLCSLRPDEDRYALSCFMEIDREANVVRHEIAETVIRSRRRLSYEEAQAYLDAKPAQREKSPCADVGEDLLALRDVARLLADARMQRGALDLDMPETKVTCNAEGDTIGVGRYERRESNRLVEECMLIANETVARHMKQNKLPTLYRVHDIPDPTALKRLAPALAMFGVQVPPKIKPTPKSYQPIVDRLHGMDGGHIGQRLLLRTLKRAEYSPENRGHFGLASTNYCHFTSPIRRYPDLLVHRALKTWLQGKADEDWRDATEATLEATANQSNLTAENAQRIEREATDIKAMEFMKDQEGGTFEGWISGFVRRGFFVELVEYPVDGFVNLRDLESDFYELDESGVKLVGRNTRRTFRLGQRIRVLVERVNPEEGEMDLLVLDKRKDESRKKKKKGKKRKKAEKA